MKKILLNVIFWIFVLLLPYAVCVIIHLVDNDIVIGNGGSKIENHLMGKDVMIEIRGLYKSIDVEEYVAGVMPDVISPDYNMETLKTMAVLIRTNVLKEMQEKNTKDAADLSYRYITKEDREQLWGRINFNKYEMNIEQAVSQTAGKVVTYEDAYIMALYHEVSIGKTADASEVIDEDVSYLKSVESNKDVEAKDYMNVYEFPGKTASIEESTENGFVKKVTADEKTYTGQEFADLMGLPSINYYIENTDDGMRIVCLGKGSCLGVSIYGANVMAEEGKSMEDIITYYYSGVSIGSVPKD